MVLYGRAAERYATPSLEGEDRLGCGGERVPDRVSFIKDYGVPHLRQDEEKEEDEEVYGKSYMMIVRWNENGINRSAHGHHITKQYNTVHIIISHRITSHRITSHHITSHRITSHHITSHHITSYHITSHHILLDFIISRTCFVILIPV